MTLDMKIGDPWPFKSARGITGAPCDPIWYALITAPSKERETRHRLQSAGCTVKYPTIEKTRHQHGKKRSYIQPVIPRIIYARFRYQPQWDVMRDRRVIVGVFSRGDAPIVLSEDDISRVMGLPTEAERLDAERLDAIMPRPGEKAEIIEGPFAGFFVDVDRVEYGRVWFSMAAGLKGDIALPMVKRCSGG